MGRNMYPLRPSFHWQSKIIYQNQLVDIFKAGNFCVEIHLYHAYLLFDLKIIATEATFVDKSVYWLCRSIKKQHYSIF